MPGSHCRLLAIRRGDLASGGNCGVWSTRNPGGICSTFWSTSSSAPSPSPLRLRGSLVASVTYWFWSRWLPQPTEGLPALLGYPGRFDELTFNTVLAALLLITAPFVLRGLVRLHGAVAYALLVDETPALRQQVSDLT